MSRRLISALFLFGVGAASGLDAVAATQSQNYYYDPAGRLIVVVDPANGSATYNYDADGNIVSVVRAPLTTVVAAQISPSAAATGATVTIYGTGFGTTANTTVSFNGVSATVSAATATALTVKVPSGATSGVVKVTAPGGSATTAYSFTVSGAAPTVTSVPSGALAQGSTISVGGAGFDTNPVNDVVIINNMRARVTAATATQLTLVVPVCVGSSPVQVETAYGVGKSAASVLVLPAGQTAANLQTSVASALGGSANLSFDGTGRAILVTFSATQGQSVLLYFSAASASMAGYTQVGIYAPDGSAFFLETSVNQVVANFNYNPVQIPATGVYSVWVSPPGSTGGTATVNLVNVAAPATASLTAGGGSVGLATSSLGQQMQATFNATGGEAIALQVINPSKGMNPGNFGYGTVPGDTFTITGPNGVIYTNYMWYAANKLGFFSGSLPLPTNGTGTYSITMVPGFGDTGTLDFILYNVPPPASAALTTGGAPNSLTTTTPGQTFSATFEGTAGQVISLDLLIQSGTLGSGGGDVVTITGPTGQIFQYNWAYYSPSEIFTGPLTLPAGGTGLYTISDAPAGTETGQLQLTLYTVPAPATAALAVGGSAATLATTVPGQTFAPTFTASANERISLLMNVVSGALGSGGGDAVTITGPTGSVYTSTMAYYENSAQLFSGLVTLPATGAGTYTISDVPYFTETGQLSFQVAQVPPDATATIAIGGAAVSLATTAPAQNMALTFSASAGQTISLLNSNFTGTLASQDYNVIISAPDGTQVYSGGPCCGASSYFTGNLNLTETGTYTITLTPNGLASGGATFQLYNEAALTSTLTPGGGSVGLTTTSPDQTMNLSMAETSGHRVAVLAQLSAGVAAAGISFTILDPDGSTQLLNFVGLAGSSVFTGALPSASISSTAPPLTQTGNYAVSLTPLGLAMGTATFTAWDVPPDAAGTVSVGQNATFNVTTPGQGLRATYAGTGGASATFTVSPTSVNPTPVCFNVTVLEPDGATALNAGQACSGAYSTGSLALPSSGNYLVVAAPNVPATGTFTVGVTSP